MKYRSLLLLVSLLSLLAIALPALADAPATGTVYEGVGVPGVALADTRAQVAAAYGDPATCTQTPYYETCQYDVDGGGRVVINYHAPDGGAPEQPSPDDAISTITWWEAVSGWVTTAGVNTTLAKNDPQAVIDAYPDAEITYWYSGTYVRQVKDWQIGISIDRTYDFYSASSTATITIFRPQDPPPEPEPVKRSYVADIVLTDAKIKRNREITAQVLVNDYQDQAAEGATVLARWHLPDGNEQSVQAVTSGDGYATFALFGSLDRGVYYLFIDDVQLTDHIWNSLRGFRSGSITVK
jgi:hypothetical protein